MDHVFLRSSEPQASSGRVSASQWFLPVQDSKGASISADARDDWSSAIYERFGIYTSLNSAPATWATIADS